jgi:tetratricopeptide (TPR) repeat protein
LAALGLVETHDDPTGRRFSMLPTIQAFAASHASDTGIADTLALRHANFFQRWVAGLQTDLAEASKIVLQRVRADGDNLRASLEWFARHDPPTGLTFASDLGRYWAFRGSMDEGLAWYDTLLQRAGPVEQAPRAQLRASVLANYGGQPRASRRFAEQSLEAYRRRGDAHGAALAIGVLGDLDLRGALEDSVRHSREAAAILESTGDSYYLSYVLDNLAGGLLQLGDVAEAERTVRRAIAIARQNGHPYRLAVGIRILASILRLRGDPVAADRLLDESDSLVTGLDDIRFGATWFGEWAVVAAAHGDIERARELAAVALTKATQRADRAAMGWALWAEGEVRLSAGEQAAGLFAQALTKLRHHAFPLRRVEVLTGLALAVDEPEIAAAAAAAAVAVRDEHHMVLPARIAARLSDIWQRWASSIGTDQWEQQVSDLSTRPHDELLDLLARRRAPRAL